MSNTKSSWRVGVYDGFYWIGIAMTLVCFGLILSGNTEPLWRFEHRSFPISWAFAGAAVLAFLAAEFCHFALSLPAVAEEKIEERSEFSPEWEAVES